MAQYNSTEPSSAAASESSNKVFPPPPYSEHNDHQASIRHSSVSSYDVSSSAIPASTVTSHSRLNDSGFSGTLSLHTFDDYQHATQQASKDIPPSPSTPVSEPAPASTNMPSIPIDNTSAIQDLIDGTPEIQKSLFSLFKATIAAAKVEEPRRLLREKDIEIDCLKRKLTETTDYGTDKNTKILQLEAKVRTLQAQSYRLATEKSNLESDMQTVEQFSNTARTKINALDLDLRAAREFGNSKHAKVFELEADKEVLTNTGLEQVKIMEELHRENQQLKEKNNQFEIHTQRLTAQNSHLEAQCTQATVHTNDLHIRNSSLQAQKYRLEQVERNLQKGNLALLGAMDKLKEENKKLQSEFDSQSSKFNDMFSQYNDASRNLRTTNERLRRSEDKLTRLEGTVDRLEKENRDLVLKGEEMAGSMMRAAGQWHEPGRSPVRGNKRQGNDGCIYGEERSRKYSRMMG